jgi:hypothetical protein
MEFRLSAKIQSLKAPHLGTRYYCPYRPVNFTSWFHMLLKRISILIIYMGLSKVETLTPVGIHLPK